MVTEKNRHNALHFDLVHWHITNVAMQSVCKAVFVQQVVDIFEPMQDPLMLHKPVALN